MRFLRLIVTFMFFFFLNSSVFAGEYSLSIQPDYSKEKTLKLYQPLAKYLSAQTGHKITIKTHRNFLTYWQKMKRSDDFDLVLDAAHFTDYRVQNKKYTVLAKLPGTLSFSLVAREDSKVLDISDLVLKKVATQASPSLCGIRLYEIFNDPAQLPLQVTVNDSDAAINAVIKGEVVAAIIPTSLVASDDLLHTVVTTEGIARMAISASSGVPLDVQQDIKQALLKAGQMRQGQLMLKAANILEFVNTDSAEYAGYAKLLQDLFGYETTLSLVY